MTFIVAGDETSQRNGDLVIRSSKGRNVALVYAMGMTSDTRQYADVICAALNAAFAPSHTDLMVAPEEIDRWLDDLPAASPSSNTGEPK